MADSATQAASIALHRYMCQNIVGTEKHVKTIRMMNNVRDNLISSKSLTMITSGSNGEGIDMQGSDFDVMKVDGSSEVCEDINIPFDQEKTYYAIETDDTPPGYTQLRLLNSVDNRYSELYEEKGRDRYFSSTAIKQHVSSFIFPIVHGPCVSDKDGVYVCLHSKSWITPALQWITRSNNSWPEENVKMSIVQHGTLFVPIGVKCSPNENIQWRISFSVGEKLLIYSFTHTQLLCYTMMKIIMKDVICIYSECKDLLCSYFMKTILLWISEGLSLSRWRPENLISNFMICFRRLIYCVKNSICPHYFIIENNLFENKLKGHAQNILLNRLNIINRGGWQSILSSRQFSNFHGLVINIPKEPPVFNLKKISVSVNVLEDIPLLRADSKLEKSFQKILSIDSSKIKHIYLYYMLKICQNAQTLPFPNITCNKCVYRSHKVCINRLLLHVSHDAGSGWLFLASLFYKTKQYQLAIDIIQHSLLKCTSEKISPLTGLAKIHYKLLNLDIYRKMTVFQLRKYLLVDDMHFWVDSKLFPDELQNVERTSDYVIPPVVYAHFLRFLCFHHLNNSVQCRYSLRNLQLTIKENYFISNSVYKALSYNVLCVAFQLLGDIQSAKLVFKQTIILEPDPNTNCAFY